MLLVLLPGPQAGPSPASQVLPQSEECPASGPSGSGDGPAVCQARLQAPQVLESLQAPQAPLQAPQAPLQVPS